MATMAIDTIDLSDIRTLGSLLARLPQGEATRTLATRLGVWTSAAHDGAAQRTRKFPTSYADLTDSELSDTYAYWVSELGRATELVGLLEGLRKLVDLLAKQHRASARAKVRKTIEEDEAKARTAGEKFTRPTATAIADQAEEDEAVRDIDMITALLLVSTPTVAAFKEACLAVTTGLSREISFRQAQLGARVR